jgi:hypothetical protein
VPSTSASGGGNNRQPCFFAEEDYRFYLRWIEAGAKKHGPSWSMRPANSLSLAIVRVNRRAD